MVPFGLSVGLSGSLAGLASVVDLGSSFASALTVLVSVGGGVGLTTFLSESASGLVSFGAGADVDTGVVGTAWISFLLRASFTLAINWSGAKGLRI